MVVGVYGLGRFGAFWAQCLAEHFAVKGYSRSAARPVPEGVQRVSEEEVLAVDALFLCVAISAIESVVGRIAGRLAPGTVVMDTCSVKMHPVALMRTGLPTSVSVIGTHPMFGPDSGRNGIYGLPLVFCPVRVESTVAESWRSRFVSMGLDVRDLSPEAHDREAAYTQGITHFMGRVLNDMDLRPSTIGTVGYGKLLEIIEQTCNDPFQLFVDLQKFNPYTGEMRRRLERSIRKFQASLDS